MADHDPPLNIPPPHGAAPGGQDFPATSAPPADQWVFLIDPAWRPADEDADPPPQAVVGGWFVQADGTTGRFRANPAYQPSMPGSPTDPLDATMQLVSRGDGTGDDVLAMMRDSAMSIAVDDEGAAIIAPAPDDVPAVLVTTAEAHQERVDVPYWAPVTLQELAGNLPEAGVDVLLNPGAPTSMRILTTAIRRSLGAGAGPAPVSG